MAVKNPVAVRNGVIGIAIFSLWVINKDNRHRLAHPGQSVGYYPRRRITMKTAIRIHKSKMKVTGLFFIICIMPESG